ncbi:GNAT family N-acetyltransferase [Nocardia sp. NPDC127526]|uniref:GNAT family N-acetyltransferase n=1 Tax=Nocardia sp. NPDC127526 TaxID=3345393 RepID=UPI00362CBD4D
MTQTDARTQEIGSIVVEPMSSAADARAFRDLNLEWIEKFFSVEAADLATLDHPGKIVADGGQVFIARDGAEIIGCGAMVAEGHGVYELSKMAVPPQHRGRGIGRIVLRAAVDWARAQGATEVILASNSVLANAVHLYESEGFVHVPPSELPPSPYDRANVFMKYRLNDSVA